MIFNRSHIIYYNSSQYLTLDARPPPRPPHPTPQISMLAQKTARSKQKSLQLLPPNIEIWGWVEGVAWKRRDLTV